MRCAKGIGETMHVSETASGNLSIGEAATARCAFHPDRGSQVGCDRCGTFVCDECHEVVADGRALCEGCRNIVGDLAIPWERGDMSWPRRFARTVAGTVVSPRSTLGHITAPRLPRAFAFTLLASGLGACFAVLHGAALFEMGGLPKSEARVLSAVMHAWLPAALVLYVIGAPLLGAGIAMARGAIFHGAARALGGRGKLAASLRANLYMTSLYPVVCALAFLQLLPVVGPIARIGLIAFSVAWTPLALYHVAKGVHGLRGLRAVISALAPITVGFVVAVVSIAAIAVCSVIVGMHGHAW